tara:strand:- start:325 stop:930 length:606 start_codon:yes stop_codon:yes gene_type:complete
MTISTLEATRILSYIYGENNDFTDNVSLNDVTNILAFLTNQNYTNNLFNNHGIISGKAIAPIDNNSLMMKSEIDQTSYFLQNSSQQLRGYSISQGNNNIQFTDWDSSDNFSTELSINPIIENQEHFFKQYLSQQFRSYNIAYHNNPQYYDNVVDEYIILKFNINHLNITHEQKMHTIHIFDKIISTRLKILPSKILTRIGY